MNLNETKFYILLRESFLNILICSYKLYLDFIQEVIDCQYKYNIAATSLL